MSDNEDEIIKMIMESREMRNSIRNLAIEYTINQARIYRLLLPHMKVDWRDVFIASRTRFRHAERAMKDLLDETK